MRARLLPFLFAVLSLCGHAVAGAPAVRALPAQPLVERLRDGRQLNFDLLFENPATRRWSWSNCS